MNPKVAEVASPFLSSISDAKSKLSPKPKFAKKCTAFLGLHALTSPTRFREDPNFISLRASRRATNNMVMIGLVGGLAVAGLSVATGERSRKGDRLQVAPKHTSTVASTVVTTLSQPPIGCEPVFSGLADPKRSHVFGRCIS